MLPDIAGALPSSILDDIAQYPAYGSAVPFLGVHYCGDSKCALSERVAQLGKEVWMTEGSVDTSVAGGLGWGASLNQNFVMASQSSSVAWSLIWSTLDGLEYSNRGMMGAFEPWSGHFEISAAVWATAQTTQFIDLNFTMLGVSTGATGQLAGGGSYVTYTRVGQGVGQPTTPDPQQQEEEGVGVGVGVGRGRGWQRGWVAAATATRRRRSVTVVFETLAAHSDQVVDITILGMDASQCTAGEKGGLTVWSTNATSFFDGPSTPRTIAAGTSQGSTHDGCSISLTLAPATIVTVSTERGSKLGGGSQRLEIPPSSPFPSHWSTGFDERQPGRPPLYFSDEGGNFAIAREVAHDGREPPSNLVLRQMVGVHPVTGMGPAGSHWTGPNPLPVTLVGDVNAVNLLAEVMARMPPKPAGGFTHGTDEPSSSSYAFVILCGRLASCKRPYDPDHGGDPPGDCLNLTSAGVWKVSRPLRPF